MHYADGTEAKVGDLVKGTCYNTKNADGSPRVIIGQMISITVGAKSCNCVVAFLEVSDVKPELDALIGEFQLSALIPMAYTNDGRKRIKANSDYSECKAFTLVHRPES